MALKLAGALALRSVQESSSRLLVPTATSLDFVRGSKHWNPKWKQLRRAKVMKVELPEFGKDPESMSEEEIRSTFKQQGILPPRPWVEKPFFISSTGGVFEPYVPPEGDGKVSPIHVQGAKQKLEFLEKKSKTMMAIRKIKSFEEGFKTDSFAKEVQEIYIKMHECMAKQDLDDLQRYVTERAYPEVIHNIARKTIHWKFIKEIELPRVVHARCTDVITKQNIFAQVTVRFHTQQSLAIYDRFGRLIHGSEIIAKDVLEYAVFEKHVANEYGSWRLHGKIIPDWLPSKEPSALTHIKLLEESPPVETAVVETPKEANPQ